MISRKNVILVALLSLVFCLENSDTYAQRKKTSTKKKTTSAARSASGKNGTKAKKSSSSKSKSSAARSASGRNGTKAKKSSSTKSTSSAARSASGKSGIKSTSSAARSASGQGGRSSVRSASGVRNSKRAGFVKKTAGNTVKNTETTEVVNENTTPIENNFCPIQTLIKRDYNENGDVVYYKNKSTICNAPENASEISWDLSNSQKLKEFTMKKSWISEDQAISFGCDTGFITYGSKGNYSCASYDEFCPLNEIIERNGKIYINPYTGDQCKAPVSVTAHKLSAEENLSDIATGKAYRFDCANNYYTNTDNYVECLQCPSSTPYSVKGSNIGVSSCSAIADSSSCIEGQWMGVGAKECMDLQAYNYVPLENIGTNGTLDTGAYKIILFGAGLDDNNNRKVETKYIVVNNTPKKWSAVLGKNYESALNKAGDSFIAIDGQIFLEIPGGKKSKDYGYLEIYKASGI